MIMFVTLVLTLLVIIGLFFFFYRLKTPYYRVDRECMIQALESVLIGQASENDWQVVFGLPIRHSAELERIRQQCIEIEEKYYIGTQRPPYLFSKKGLKQLQGILGQLKAPPSPT